MRLPRKFRIIMPLGWVAVSALLVGCHQAPWLSIAERGTLHELKKSVEQGQQRNAFDRSRVSELAIALLNREIRSAADPDGEGLLSQLEKCAPRLEAQLLRRSERQDQTGGTALFALVSAGYHLSSRQWEAASHSPSGAQRAAAALDSLTPERWATRAVLLNDSDPRVRRAALQSSLTAPLRSHWGTQLDILRRDPDPLCRQLAAKGIGILGGPEATTVLHDAWARADTPLRLAIVSALAQAPTFAADGQRRLVSIARSEPGIVGVSAGADLAMGTSSAQTLGRARITRSLEFGSNEERALAIEVARWAVPEHAEHLLHLGLDADLETRVRALARWLEHPAHRWPGTTWLRQLAEGDSSAAILAREVLADHGDQTARLALRAQLRYARWPSRAHAARQLWKLGDNNGVAEALADDAPEVRVATACSVLADKQSP